MYCVASFPSALLSIPFSYPSLPSFSSFGNVAAYARACVHGVFFGRSTYKREVGGGEGGNRPLASVGCVGTHRRKKSLPGV